MSNIATGRGIFAEAMVKVRVQGEVLHTAAEGNGPVNALDLALRKALVGYYPQIAHFHLSDYKVRILDSDHGTEAITRVLIDTRNDTSRWSTVGAEHEHHRSKLARAGGFGGVWVDGGALKSDDDDGRWTVINDHTSIVHRQNWRTFMKFKHHPPPRRRHRTRSGRRSRARAGLHCQQI